MIDWLFLDRKTVRIFANSSTREQSNLKRGWKLRARLGRDRRVRLARLARVRVKLNRFWEKKNWLFCSLDFFLPMSHTCFAHLRLRFAHALEQALPAGAFWLYRSAWLLMTHACALRLKSTWRQRYKVILQVTLFLYLLREVYLTDMQRILMNFAQTFSLTSSTMKFLFAISLMSVCLFLVTARFVHFIHRQEIVEDLNARDDPGVTGLSDMPSRSSSKIHIASCRHFGMLCTHDYQCCSHHCGFPSCLW